MKEENENIESTEENTPTEPQPKKRSLGRRILRFFLKTIKFLLIFILTLVLSIVIALQFSSVQTWSLGFVSNYISENTGFKTQIEFIYLDFWNSQLTLQEVKVKDPQNKEMIIAKKIYVDFDYNTVLQDGNIYLNEIYIKTAKFNIITDSKTKKMNLTLFIDRVNDLFASDTPSKSDEPSIFKVKNIKIENLSFGLHDNTIPLDTALALDFNHLDLEKINVAFKDFSVIGDSVQVQINSLKALEKNKVLNLKNLTTLFRVTSKSLEFNDLLLEANNSIIKNKFLLKFEDSNDLSDFIEKVDIEAVLDSSIISTDDLAIFVPDLKKYKDTWRVNAKFDGKINAFLLEDVDIYLGDRSHLHGTIEMTGLPNFEETLMDMQFDNSELIAQELQKYIPNEEASELLEKMGEIKFKGFLTGFANNFVAEGIFKTNVGIVQSDIKLDLRGLPKYSGELQAKGFELGEVFETPLLGKIDFDGKIKGEGFSPEQANFSLDAKIFQVEVYNYNYQDIRVDGTFGRKQFEGEFVARDENLNFDIKGILDFKKDYKNPDLPAGYFDLTSHIERISLKPLGFSAEPLTLKGDMKINARGMNLDSLRGNLQFSEASLVYGKHGLNINNVILSAEKSSDSTRYLRLDSDFLNAKIEGDFYFSNLMKDLQMLGKEYQMSLDNKSEDIIAYYEAKQEKYAEKPRPYQAKLSANVKNINPLLAIFAPDLSVSNDLSLQGDFKLGTNVIFKLYTIDEISELTYQNNKFNNIELDLHSYRYFYKPEILADFTLKSSKQKLAGFAKTENIYLNLLWDNEAINFRSKIKQAGNSNELDVAGNLNLLDNKTQIKFDPSTSKLIVLNETWKLPGENEINFGIDTVQVRDLILKNVESYSQLAVEGKVVLDSLSKDSITIEANNIQLLSIADLFDANIQGSLNGKTILKNLYSSPEIKGNFEINELAYNEFPIGYIKFGLDWDDNTERLDLDLKQARGQGSPWTIFGNGHYEPKNVKSPLFFDLRLEKTGLNIIEPFTEGLISNVRGGMRGDLKIQGPLSNLSVTGGININRGRFTFDYLGTTYLFDEAKIDFKPEEIIIDRIYLSDRSLHPAFIEGSVYHQGFQNIFLDLKGDYTEFEVLNTKEGDNNLFYGTAVASGTLGISGYLNNLTIDIEASNGKNTNIFMPLDGYYEVSNQDYIQFVDFSKDSLDSQKGGIKNVELGGMIMNFKLHVNEDAKFEIIFDKKAGDIIQATGKGDLDLKINTEGDFSISGPYYIKEGNYNFTLANLVNKGFKINSESKSAIYFNGDIFQSVLDITAAYPQRVSLKPLIDLESVEDAENPEYRRTYPVSTTLSMSGPFLTPKIELGIDLNETEKDAVNQNLQTAIRRLRNRIEADDQELNRQVFSLIVLKKLSPENAFTGLQGTTGSSLSELISNQFSNWFSQVDENLEFDLNLNTQDFNSTQLRVSYRLLDGRLRITRDGGFTNSQNQADFASVMGDWTVEYLLSSDGKYRAKMYNRTIQNAVNTANLNGGNNTVAGFSLTQTANFDNLRDLFSVKKKDKKRKDTTTVNENLKDTSWLKNRSKKKEDKKKLHEDWEEKQLETHLQGDVDNEAMPESVAGRIRHPEHANSDIEDSIVEKKTDTTHSNHKLVDEKIKESHKKGDVDNVAMPENYKKKNKKKNNRDPDNETMPEKYRKKEDIDNEEMPDKYRNIPKNKTKEDDRGSKQDERRKKRKRKK